MRRLAPCLFVLAAGCATLSSGKSKTDTRVLSVRHDTRPSGVVGEVREAPGRLDVMVVQRCEELEVKLVEHVTRTEQVNKSVALDVAFGVIGGGLLGAGVGILADAPSVYPNDRGSRTYNPNGPDAAIGLGLGLAHLGLAIGSVALVDLGRTFQVKEHRSKAEQPRTLRSAPCSPLRPIAAEILVLDEQSRTLHREVAGADGRASLDLVDILAGTVDWPTPPRNVKIYSGGMLLGEPALAPYWPAARDRADDRTWAQSSPEICAKERTEDACFAVAVYLHTRPAGLHAAEAQRLLTAAAPPPVAVDPKEAERRAKALAAAAKACVAQCAASCGKDAACAAVCGDACPAVEEAKPPPPPLPVPRAPLKVPGGPK